MLGQNCIEFLAALKANNDRDWFAAQKDAYERDLKEPGAAFAGALAAALSARVGQALEPKIYRIHRDVRFSKDKTPYNAHLHISARVLGGPDEPCFLFGLEPGQLVLGMGVFGFSKDGLTRWRDAVSGEAGGALLRSLSDLEKAGMRLGAPELKRVPAPFAADHPQAALLRRKGLTVWIDCPAEELAFGADGPSACAEKLAPLVPLYAQLRRIVIP